MMKIKRGENYNIALYEEPHKISDHNKTFIGKLTFTGVELIEAIVSVGMPDVYLTKDEKRNRREEIHFKVKLFETYVASSIDGKLFFDTSRKAYLDSTEVGAINYWIGMILTTVLGQKKYNYDFMVHLSMIELFSSKICIRKKAFISTRGEITFKSPDLLAINNLKNMYGVFESKCYSKYDKKAMERGYTQAKSIRKINGKPPKNCLVVMTQTGTKEIRMIEKDPEGENCEINVDLDFLNLYHFLPIVELIMELSPEECGNRVVGSLIYEEDCYSISIPLDLYKKISQIIKSENELLLDKSIFGTRLREAYISQLISERSDRRILQVE